MEPLEFFAVTAPGLAELAAAELEALGIRGEVDPGGVSWRGSLRDLYRANLELRTASRVLVRVGEFRATSFWELERHARSLPWQRFVDPARDVSWRVTCRKSRLYHQGAVAQRFAEAVQRSVGARSGEPSGADDEAEEDAGGQVLVVRFVRDRCTVSADSSGALLHRRGYRQAVGKAPLRETLAAAMLRASGWDGAAPLVDPMCGSGTIPIEAALIARRIPPGLARADRSPRPFAFERWPEHDPRVWEGVVDESRDRILARSPAPIQGFDRDAGAIDAAVSNARRAGVEADVHFARQPLSALRPPAPRGWLVTNPPYGRRVGHTPRLRDLYACLGNLYRDRFHGWHLCLLSAEPALTAQLGLEFEEKLRTTNGGVEVRVLSSEF